MLDISPHFSLPRLYKKTSLGALQFWEIRVFSRELSTDKTIVGEIDSDYSGEVKLFFVNTGLNPIAVSPKDRVAQLLFMPVERVAWKIVSDHEPTERGTGGFGSTGRD